MNSLSWLIYLGAVSGSAGGFLIFLAVVGAMIALIGFIFSVVWTDSERLRAQYETFNKRGGLLIGRGLSMLIVCGVLSTLLPDRNTVYAIAASQVGEKIASNGEVTDLSREALATLKDWLKTQRDGKAI